MVLTGYSRGKRAWIPRIPLSPTENCLTSSNNTSTVSCPIGLGYDNQQGSRAKPPSPLGLSMRHVAAFPVSIGVLLSTSISHRLLKHSSSLFSNQLPPTTAIQLAARCSTFGFRLWLIPTTTRIRTWTVCTFSRWRSHTHSLSSVDPGPFPGARRRRPCRCKPLYTEYRLP